MPKSLQEATIRDEMLANEEPPYEGNYHGRVSKLSKKLEMGDADITKLAKFGKMWAPTQRKKAERKEHRDVAIHGNIRQCNANSSSNSAT